MMCKIVLLIAICVFHFGIVCPLSRVINCNMCIGRSLAGKGGF